MRTLRLLAFSCLATAPLSAQVIADMTPDNIKEAIAYGIKQKEMPAYEIRKGGFIGSVYKPRLGFFTTPFLRVAQAAYEAKRNYKPFTSADVRPEMLTKELRVYGIAQATGARVSNVRTIVITPEGKHGLESAIRPDSISEVPEQFRNLFGMTAQGTSLLAVFPLSVLSEENEMHIVYDSGVHAGSENKFCEDCSVRFKLGDVH